MTLPRSGSPYPPNGQKRPPGTWVASARCPGDCCCSCSSESPSWRSPGCSRGAFCAHRRCPSPCRLRSRRCCPISRCRPSRTSRPSDRGRRRLRAVHGGRPNVGVGAFIVHAVRGDRRGPWRVSQRFDEPDGSTSETVTNGDVVWGGHGHDHWHVHLGASYWLTRPGSSVVLRSYDKVGFCFFDQRPLVTQPLDRAEAPAVPEERLQRPRHARVHDGPVAGLGRPVPVGAARSAASADGSPRRRLPPLGDGRPRSLVPRGQRDEQRHVGRSPACSFGRPLRASRSSAGGPRAPRCGALR